jgi:hypothetical protein
MEEVRTQNKKVASMWLKDTSKDERKTLIAAFADFETDALTT